MPQDNSAPRFYCENLPDELADNSIQVSIDKSQTHHAHKVLRLSAGASVELFNGFGVTAQCAILKYEQKQAICTIKSVEKSAPLLPQVTVASAVPKGSHGDILIDQLSQIGVSTFIPLRTARSTVNPRPAKLERYQAIAIEAARQCKRDFLLQVADMHDFEQVVNLKYDLALIGSTLPEAQPDDFISRIKGAKNILIAIGPEGDFTDEELVLAQNSGFIAWHFARHVLRVESAAMTAAAIIGFLAQR